MLLQPWWAMCCLPKPTERLEYAQASIPWSMIDPHGSACQYAPYAILIAAKLLVARAQRDSLPWKALQSKSVNMHSGLFRPVMHSELTGDQW